MTLAAQVVLLERAMRTRARETRQTTLTIRALDQMLQERFAFHLSFLNRPPLALARLLRHLPPTNISDDILHPASRNPRVLCQGVLEQLCEWPKVTQSRPTSDHALRVFERSCELSEGGCGGRWRRSVGG